MPATLSYPGVYIEELPSAVRSIASVATSITAFVGRAWRGPADQAVMVFSYTDYTRQFGGLWRDSTMSYAVKQFFDNGGTQAVIVRVATRTGNIAQPASFGALANGLTLAAASPGSWGMNLLVSIDTSDTKPNPITKLADHGLFHLTVVDDSKTVRDNRGFGGSGAQEVFLNVSVNPNNPRYLKKVLEQQSQLLRMTADATGANTNAATAPSPTPKLNPLTSSGGTDGDFLVDADVVGQVDPITGAKTGIYTLYNIDLFNLLCLPPLTPGASGTDDLNVSTWQSAAALCEERRAFLIVDAPNTWSVTDAKANIGTFSAINRNHSAIYFPRLQIPDPLQEGKLESYAPCGVVAGVIARTDGARGIWKAPAGIEASLQGVLGLTIKGKTDTLNDNDVGLLNPVGINSLRSFPTIGHVVWGARTLEGADVLASQWKYVPVRRLALFIEESLFRGTQWVVFEPNDEPLWSQIRLNVGAFMQTLFRQGAFQGAKPSDAYFVKCSKETTTQTDIDNGIVNIVVGFAPLKPAEFVVLQIQQIAPQS